MEKILCMTEFWLMCHAVAMELLEKTLVINKYIINIQKLSYIIVCTICLVTNIETKKMKKMKECTTNSGHS
jgi:hypothetical protein